MPELPTRQPLESKFAEGYLTIVRNELQTVTTVDIENAKNELDSDYDFTDIEDMVFETKACAADIRKNPELYGIFGFSTTNNDGLISVTSPTNEQLNKLRAKIPTIIGLHTGTFIDFTPSDLDENGFIEIPDFAEILADRKIPMTTLNPLNTHDNLFHRIGYMIMCQEIFNRFVKSTRQALAENNRDRLGRIIDNFDALSGFRGVYLGLEGRSGGQHLSSRYGDFMPFIDAGIYGTRDAKAQRRTAKKLLKHSESI